MPIYEYRCKDCSFQLEALQKISDTPLLDCPECKHPTLEKCISAVAMRLSGGGYYETDEKPRSQQRHISRSEDSSGGACATPAACGTTNCG